MATIRTIRCSERAASRPSCLAAWATAYLTCCADAQPRIPDSRNLFPFYAATCRDRLVSIKHVLSFFDRHAKPRVRVSFGEALRLDGGVLRRAEDNRLVWVGLSSHFRVGGIMPSSQRYPCALRRFQIREHENRPCFESSFA